MQTPVRHTPAVKNSFYLLDPPKGPTYTSQATEPATCSVFVRGTRVRGGCRRASLRVDCQEQDPNGRTSGKEQGRTGLEPEPALQSATGTCGACPPAAPHLREPPPAASLLPAPWSLQCCPWPARLYPELVLWEPDPCLPHLPAGTRDQHTLGGHHTPNPKDTSRPRRKQGGTGSALPKLLVSLSHRESP